MIEFGKPFAGWIKISFDNKYFFYASYLTDVPIDMLNGAINMLEGTSPFVLEIDTESRGCYTIYNSPIHYCLYIIGGEENIEIEYFDSISLAKTIFNYINDNKNELYRWNFDEDEDEEIDKYRNVLDEKLKKLDYLIKNKEKE